MPIRRRTLLSGFPVIVNSWVATRGEQKNGAADGFKVDINIGEGKPDAVVAILRQVNAKNIQTVKENGLGGIETIVASAMAAKGLANLIFRLLSTWSCGLVVDARAARILMERNCKSPRTVVIISPDGTRSEMPQPSVQQIEARVEKFAHSK